MTTTIILLNAWIIGTYLCLEKGIWRYDGNSPQYIVMWGLCASWPAWIIPAATVKWYFQLRRFLAEKSLLERTGTWVCFMVAYFLAYLASFYILSVLIQQ